MAEPSLVGAFEDLRSAYHQTFDTLRDNLDRHERVLREECGMSIELSEDGRVKLAASSELQSARKRLRLLEDTQVPQLSSALRLSKRELAQAQGALRREEEMRQAAEEAAAVVRSQLATVRDLLRQGGQGKGKRAARASLNRVRESLLGCNLLFPEGQASHRASLMLEEEEDEEDEDYEEDEEDEESAADLAAAHQVSFAAEEEGASAQASPASPAPQPVRSILRRPGSRRERASSVPESMVLRGRLAASPQHPPSSPLARASHTAVSPAAAAEPHTPPGDGEAAGGVRGRAMNRSISMSALSARQTRALAGSRVRCHMLEESTAVRPGKCGVCSKNIGFKARHLHCHQCQQSFHDMCQPLVRADCRPPAFGTPEAKKRRAPPLGSNLAAAVSAYSRNGLVPGFVADAVATLNRRAVHVENIFEAPPSTAAQPKLLTTKFFLGDSRPNFDTVACIHDVAHALLLFLGQLDEPLTTIPLYESFKAAIDNKRSDRAVHEALALVLAKLPPVNFHTLHLIVTHLRLISSKIATTKMSVHSLAKVFGPLLLRSPDGEAINKKECVLQQRVVERLLRLPDKDWETIAEEMEHVDHTQSASPPTDKQARMLRRKSSKFLREAED